MGLSPADWIKLNRLLDEALDLEPAQRTRWVESLAPEYASLRDTLRDLLLREGGVETCDVVRMPELPAPTPIRPHDLVGPYRLIREIGTGGMAAVWLAERADGSLHRQVALKLPRVGWLDGNFSSRMLRERDILATLEHPNIARLYDAGADAEGRPFLALEYVDGIPLDEYLRVHTPPLAQRLELFLAIARPVAYAHTQLIVHRDLKPSNILVRADGNVSLLDFGIARLLQGDSQVGTHLTQFAGRMLTPQYAAPEQFTSKPITAATDVYSLGVLFYELLTGVSPYTPKRKTSAALEDAVLQGSVTPPSVATQLMPARALRGDLDSIVQKALRKSPQNRYASVEAMISDVDAHRAGRPITARPATRWYYFKKFVLRNAGLVGAASAVLLTLVAGLTASLIMWREAASQRERAEESLAETEATVDFTSAILTDYTRDDESITLDELLARSEAMIEKIDAGDLRSHIAAALFVSRWHIANGHFEKAERVLTRTIDAIPATVDIRARSELICKRAGVWGHLGRSADSQTAFSAEIARTKSRGDDSSTAYCLLTRGQVAREADNVAGTLTDSLEAMKYFQRSGRRSLRELGILHGEVGLAQARAGRMDEAMKNFQEGLDLLERAGKGESADAFILLNNWSTATSSSRDSLQTLALLERALKIAQRRSATGDPPQIPLGNYASALVVLARYDEATAAFAQQEMLARRENDVASLLYIWNGRAEIAVSTGQLDAAQQLLDEAAQMSRDKQYIGGPRIALMHKGVQATLWTKRGRNSEAAALSTEALQGYRDLKCCIRLQVLGLLSRAEANRNLANLKLARQDAEEALAVAKRQQGNLPYSDLTGASLQFLGELDRTGGDDDAARRAFAEALRQMSPTLGDQHPAVIRARGSL